MNIDCPDGVADDGQPDLHATDCPRVNTCGQIGPPYLPPPFHSWPTPPSMWNGWLIQHAAEVHGIYDFTPNP